MSTTAVAADYKKNPFTLVYAGAITKNELGKVNWVPRYVEIALSQLKPYQPPCVVERIIDHPPQQPAPIGVSGFVTVADDGIVRTLIGGLQDGERLLHVDDHVHGVVGDAQRIYRRFDGGFGRGSSVTSVSWLETPEYRRPARV